MSVLPRAQTESRPSSVTCLHRFVDVTSAVGLDGEHAIAADVFLPPPERLSDPAVVLCCLPGGALAKGYYDLGGAADPSYSCANHLAAAGVIVITLDHLGVGESSRPRDGFELYPEVIARANHRAFEILLGELQAGSLHELLPALPNVAKVGVGHSAGSFLTIVQQAGHHTYDGLALLGSSNAGHTGFLLPDEARFVGDPAGMRANLVHLAQERFGEPYPVLPQTPEADFVYFGTCTDRRAIEALTAARTNLLALVAVATMIAGSIGPELQTIDVPVFLGIGEHDICGPPHHVPAKFPSSRDVTLIVVPGAGHCHNIFPARRWLWERLESWARTVVAAASLQVRG
jgi:pimeloyl-ACP methyl ester carboxylesterase